MISAIGTIGSNLAIVLCALCGGLCQLGNTARQLRVQFPGAIYHVTIRGNAKESIFEDGHDRERFLRRLADSVDAYRVRLYLFCLMRNHVHLVLETLDEAEGIKVLQSIPKSATDWKELADFYLRELEEKRQTSGQAGK